MSRFLPDALSKLSIARDVSFIKLKYFSIRSIFLFLFAGFIVAETTARFIQIFLGDDWLLPLTLLFAITLIEIVRGIFNLLTMDSVRQFHYSQLKRIALFQLVFGLLVQPLLIHFFGILGAILTSLVLYIPGILYLRQHTNG